MRQQMFLLLFLAVVVSCQRGSGRRTDRPPRRRPTPARITFTEEPKPCTVQRQRGVCIKYTDCRNWGNLPRNQPPCKWEGNVPFICCLQNRDGVVTTRRPGNTKGPNLRTKGCGYRTSLNGGVGNLRVKRRGSFPTVVGGTISLPNSWPWMVAIIKKGPRKTLHCGASLISPRYLLTAAHCFTDRDPSKYTARLGAHNTNEGVDIDVESITVHPDYDKKYHYNDIALVRLKEPVTYNNKISAVCLPTPDMADNEFSGRSVTVTGWGDTSFGGPSSKVLQEASFPVVANSGCSAAYTKVAASSFPRGVTDTMLCAGLTEGGKDACQGDSGGPLVLSEGLTWTQVGIVSFGYMCAEPEFPGIYTRVGKFNKWIAENSDVKNYV